MADLMDMRWLVRDINHRAVDEVRIQHIFTPGLPDEIRREKVRRRKFAKAESHIPFYFILDISYIWASFLSAAVSLVYFLIFFTLLGWTPSIQSFAGEVTTRVGENDNFHDMVESKGYHARQWAGYYLFLAIILFSISWYSFFGAGIVGRRFVYVVSLVNHSVLLALEVFAVTYAFARLPTTCDTSIFREHMLKYFLWYGILAPHKENHGHEAMNKIDAVQASLACCGIDSYKDYEKIFATIGDPAYNASWYPPEIHLLESFPIFNLDYYQTQGREIRQLPHSCCTPFWRQNVYCADDIFTMERMLNQTTVAKDRLNTRGCVQAVGEACERLTYLMTRGMLGIVCFRGFLCLVMFVVTAVTLRSMQLVMTTLFSVTRGNVRFIYDYRKTRPEEDPYKKALGDFRRGVVPEGWEEFIQNRIEGRKKALPISEQFTIGQLVDNADMEDKLYRRIIQKWKGPKIPGEGKPVYFGIDGDPNMKEAEFLAIRGKEKELRQANNIFDRLAKLGADHRRDEGGSRDEGQPIGHKYSTASLQLETLYPIPLRDAEVPKKVFKDEIPFVQIPEAASPTDRLIQEKQKQVKPGFWKDMFKKSIENVTEIISGSKSRKKMLWEEFERRQERKLQQEQKIGPPPIATEPVKVEKIIPAPPVENAQKREVPPPEFKVTKQKPRKPVPDKDGSSAKEDRNRTSDKKKTRKASVDQKKPKQEHDTKGNDKATKAKPEVQPKLEDIQHKVSEKPEKIEVKLPIQKRRRSSADKRPKAAPRSFDAYGTPAEVVKKKQKDVPAQREDEAKKHVTSGKPTEKRRTNDPAAKPKRRKGSTQENPPTTRKKTLSLPVLTAAAPKKKKRKRRLTAIEDRRPWRH